MSTKLLFILIAIVTVLLVATVYVGFFKTEDMPNDTATPALPTSPQALPPTTDGKMRIGGREGSTIEVTDFIHNTETVADTVNLGHYVLAGSLGYCLGDGACPSGAPSSQFSISYSEQYQSFNIVLLAEPLLDARRSAEEFLMSRLGVGEEDMCKLNVSLGAPHWVSELYSGRELGLSFCPDAVAL